MVSCQFADAGGAGRLLSSHVRELILAILGEETALAAAPTRDSLLACAAHDVEGASWLQEEARSRFAEGPFPVYPGLFHISAGHLHPVAEVGLSGSEEGEAPPE